MKNFMGKFITLIISMALISAAVFIVFQILPGDPALIILGVDADPNQIAALRQNMGLDLPIFERYINWIKGAFTGDLGISLKYGVPVGDLILSRLSVTLFLGLTAILMSIIIGVPAGILLSKYSGAKTGRLLSALTQLGLAIPTFWVGLMLMLVFSVMLNIFPSGRFVPLRENVYEFFKGLFLPALSMAVGNSAIIIRFMKNSIHDNLQKDYVRTARSRGNSENRVLYTHVLKNALMPIITITGMITAETLSGSIIVENVFSLPGLGQLVVNAINSRDLPLAQGVCLYIAFVVVVVNFIVDIIYKLVDPRLK